MVRQRNGLTIFFMRRVFSISRVIRFGYCIRSMLIKAIQTPKLKLLMVLMVRCTPKYIPTGHRKVDYLSMTY